MRRWSRWRQRKALTPSSVDRVEYEAPQRCKGCCERGHATLKGAWRTDAEEHPHPETEIERAGMHEQPLQHVVVAADMRATKSAGLVEMCARALEQFSAPTEEAFAATAADATAIRVHSISFRGLIDPRLWSAVGFADIGANVERFQIEDGRPTVVTLVGDDFVDDGDCTIGNRGDGFELLGGFGQGLLHGGGVALVGVLHGDADDRARLEIDRMLGFVR